MPPQQITILGVGLLGGSIGLALKSVINNCKIIGYGHRPQTLEAALNTGAIDEGNDDPARAVRDSDLVILCTPVGLFNELLLKIAPALRPGCIITDVGSTKRSVVAHAAKTLPHVVHFVGSHPMAGSEKRGVEFARADLFRHALCILTPTPQTNPAAVQTIESFWQTLGMRTTRLTPDDHDRLLADVSHLPHLLAAALVAMQHDDALNLSGKGFLDTTRIAGGDGALWRDILMDNSDNVRAGLARLMVQLSQIDVLLKGNGGEELKHWLDQSAQRREQLLQKKLREIHPD